MPKQGTLQEPQFKTRSGVVLKLGAVNGSAQQMYMNQWQKKNPPPQPPIITLQNGEPWQNVTDDTFKVMYNTWLLAYGTASMNFVFKYGILSQPPDDWECPYEEMDTHDKHQRKMVWLTTILSEKEPNEYEALNEAIAGLTRPTQAGVLEAEKNL